MTKNPSRRDVSAAALATIAASVLPAPYVWAAEKKYDAGASDTEIKIGQTVPHSGPGSLYGVLGRVGEAYFQMLNEKGGINGRKVKFLTMDDAYSAPKCVEATRRLVEQEEVLALYGSLGTAPQTAVHKYLNSKGVPQLLLNTGASKWNNPKEFKWTMAGLPLYPTEARILAQARRRREAERQGRHPLPERRFRPRLPWARSRRCWRMPAAPRQVIMEQTYDLTDPTVDSQLINLSKSGADVFYNITTGKATSQSIRKVAELGWKPLQLLSAGSTGRSILSAAGFENANGIVAIRYSKDAGPGRWEKDPDVMAFEELRKKYLPNVDPDNTIAYAGYGQAVTMGEILRRCGDDLTRANVLKQASNLNGFHSPFFLDGVSYSYTPDDYTPMKTLFIPIFNGKDWEISDKPVIGVAGLPHPSTNPPARLTCDAVPPRILKISGRAGRAAARPLPGVVCGPRLVAARASARAAGEGARGPFGAADRADRRRQDAGGISADAGGAEFCAGGSREIRRLHRPRRAAQRRPAHALHLAAESARRRHRAQSGAARRRDGAADQDRDPHRRHAGVAAAAAAALSAGHPADHAGAARAAAVLRRRAVPVLLAEAHRARRAACAGDLQARRSALARAGAAVAAGAADARDRPVGDGGRAGIAGALPGAATEGQSLLRRHRHRRRRGAAAWSRCSTRASGCPGPATARAMRFPKSTS